jgi:LemA protein
MTPAWWIGGVVVAAIALLVYAFNRIVRMRNLVRNAWSDIDVQLKRRADLVPSLVEVVRGYTQHERQLFEEIAEARTRVGLPGQTPAERAQAEGTLAAGIGRLIALAESYPELKASGQYTQLQEQLTTVEDDIANARRYYNGAAADFNTMIQSFPNVLAASAMGFHTMELFAATEAEIRATPAVRFEGAPQ